MVLDIVLYFTFAFEISSTPSPVHATLSFGVSFWRQTSKTCGLTN